MMIERFSAEDMSHAIRQVKAKMGAEAVILSNERKGDLVEVLAAADYDAALLGEISVPVLRDNFETGQDTKPVVDVSTMELQEELKSLRNTLRAEIAELQNYKPARETRSAKKIIAGRLEELGLSPEVTRMLADHVSPELKKVPGWRQTLKLLGSALRTGNNEVLEEGGIYAVVGSTGVGKTTTVAKLATQFSYRHGANQVALITTDNFRIGGQEQLAAFSRALGVPVSFASNVSELTRSIREYRHKKLVLIDTAGMSQKDLDLAKHLVHLNQTDFDIKNYVVLSATSQMGLTQEVIRAFHRIPLHGAVITKTDEALNLGPVLSGIIPNRLPVTYICNGQNIPEDLEPATKEYLLSTVVRMKREHPAENAFRKESRIHA